MLNKKKVKWIILACVSVAIITGFFGKKHAIPAPLLNYMRNAPLARHIQWKISYLHDRLSNMIKGALDKDEHRPLKADFHDPSGIYVDSLGRIYFSERRNHVIRMIADGKLTTIAGNRRSGFSGDGKKASSLRLNYPEGLAGDRKENLLIADSGNHRIRMISNDGSISTIAGTGIQGYSGDHHEAKKARLNKPMDVCTDPFGNIHIADWGNHRIRRITSDGIITTVAGVGKAGFSGDGGPAGKASLNGPYGVYADRYGNIYIADSGNHRIRKISSEGIISTIAGTGVEGFSGDGGAATDAQLNNPQAVFVTRSKEIYINDEHNHRIRKILSSGIIITIAGNGRAGYWGDGGPATDACLYDPEGIWVDDTKNLFVTDGDNHRIRKVNPNGIITTIAGSGPIGKYKDKKISLGMLSAPGLRNRVPLSGQIIVDPNNPAWLKYNEGGPFFMAGPGDPEGFLYRGSRSSDGTRNGDQMDLINNLKGTGANCIYLMAVRSHGGDGDSTHNPFIDSDPSKGFDQDILDQWESWFAEMDNNGIVIFFIFYDDSARIWNTGDSVGSEEKAFIHTLVNEFEHHKNLIWCVAEEYQERFTAQRVKNIAWEIAAADDHAHVIAVHKLNGLSFSEFADDPNIDQFAIQYNNGSSVGLHNGMITAWDNAAGRYNLNMSEAGNYGTGEHARKKNWAIAMGGAYVMALGWDIVSTPMSTLEDCGRLVRFMESTNFNEMAPHDELKCGGTEYVLALPGDSYIAYASSLSGNIGLKGMAPGSYDIKWYDVTNNNTVIQENVSVSSGAQTWTKPESIGNELALYLKRISGSENVAPTANNQ